jgi:hypothetical protein
MTKECDEWMLNQEIYPVDLRDQNIGESERCEVESAAATKLR